MLGSVLARSYFGAIVKSFKKILELCSLSGKMVSTRAGRFVVVVRMVLALLGRFSMGRGIWFHYFHRVSL